MPNSHAAIKDLRKNHRRAARNARLKTHIKALDRAWKPLLQETKVGEAATSAVKILQKIASKGAKQAVIHRNKAARLISRAHRALRTAVTQ